MPDRITIHHTAAASGPGKEAVESIRHYHVEERGWSDIAYHVLIDEDGHLWFGRPFDQAPDSHSDYDFTGHIAVALLGNYEENAPGFWTQPRLAALTAVVQLLAFQYDISPDNIQGHCDYDPGTDCPGRYLYELLPELRKAVGTPPSSTEER